jgi:hypothetical protein
MSSLKSEIKNIFSHINSDTAIEAVIIEDNKYKVGDTLNFKNLDTFSDALLPQFKEGNFKITGGGDREFYIASENCNLDFTFQIYTFEYDKEIDLGV